MSGALRIVVVGAGNVGTKLSQRLCDQGCRPFQIYSRSPRQNCDGIPVVLRMEEIFPHADLYLIAVPDDSIAAVAELLSQNISTEAFVVHTSGSTPSTVLAPYFRRYGVCYPLQTFSTGRVPDFNEIPICIYAPSKEDLKYLKQVGNILSASVHVLDDKQRAQVHLAAVFVNNFVNYLYHTGYQLLKEDDLPFELLIPLIKETAAKVQPEADPAWFQTGPAKRGDEKTILRHLDALQKYPELKDLYEHLTRAIQTTHQKQI